MRHSISSDGALQFVQVDVTLGGSNSSDLRSPRQLSLHDRASSESDLACDPGSRPSLSVDR